MQLHFEESTWLPISFFCSLCSMDEYLLNFGAWNPLGGVVVYDIPLGRRTKVTGTVAKTQGITGECGILRARERFIPVFRVVVDCDGVDICPGRRGWRFTSTRERFSDSFLSIRIFPSSIVCRHGLYSATIVHHTHGDGFQRPRCSLPRAVSITLYLH